MYIYAEYLLLENLIINYAILYITRKFTRTETSKLRLLIASLIGALYTFVVFYPSLKFMTKYIVKISISILIIIIAFNPAKLRKFIKLFATFYVISFAFAGAALALFYFTNVDIYVGHGIFLIKEFSIKNFSPKILVIAIILSGILIKFTWGYLLSRIQKEEVLVNITIELNGVKVDLPALIDTGNSLKDPITEAPVVVVEFSAIKDLLPRNIQRIFYKYKENNLEIISAVMTKSMDEIKFRLIPFKSLGKENGMLLGFKPDKVTLNDNDKNFSNIIIGIYNNNLSTNNDYMALLHPEILN